MKYPQYPYNNQYDAWILLSEHTGFPKFKSKHSRKQSYKETDGVIFELIITPPDGGRYKVQKLTALRS